MKVNFLSGYSPRRYTLLKPIKDIALCPERPERVKVLLRLYLFGNTQASLIFILGFFVPVIDRFYLIWPCPEWGGTVFGMFLGVIFSLVGWGRMAFERGSLGVGVTIRCMHHAGTMA